MTDPPGNISTRGNTRPLRLSCGLHQIYIYIYLVSTHLQPDLTRDPTAAKHHFVVSILLFFHEFGALVEVSRVAMTLKLYEF